MVYDICMVRNKKRLSKAVEEAKRRAAGLASTTKNRKINFKDRKKDAAHKACRKWKDES